MSAPSGQTSLAPQAAARANGQGPAPAGARVRRTVLRVPLFAKILIANAVVVAAVAVTGAAVAVRSAGTGPGMAPAALIAWIALWGVVVSVVVNAVILRVALAPVRDLERTALRVQQGDLGARARASALADPELERLALTFNALLDRAVAYRERLREVAARALSAAEEERKRLARELHDGTAQTLAGLRVRLRLARVAEHQAERDAQLEQVSMEIGAAIEEVRRMARGLRPPVLDLLGLAPAIESYARPIMDAAGVGLDVVADPAAGALEPETELALYRIMQEALSNVVRHAGASFVRIRLERNGGGVALSVEDDGGGFDVGAALSGRAGGLGLFGMQERAAYVGGSVDITSTPGGGTEVAVTVPVMEASRHA